MAYIEVIEPSEAEGDLQVIYDDLLEKRGQVAEVHKIHSLNPQSMVNHMDLYMTLMFGKSPLKRVLREMVAVVVSRANNCEYCQTHHGAAVQHYWKDEARVEQLKTDYRDLALNEVERTLCDLAWQLTKNPSEDTKAAFVEPLQKLGLSDRAILDATLIIAYFNFVNRIVMGLGVHVESDLGAGYNYD
jgi:uncharacterized peroxidase-related enzyme